MSSHHIPPPFSKFEPAVQDQVANCYSVILAILKEGYKLTVKLTVYEGKSLAGMMDLIRKGEIPEGSNVLYAHLGGQLALNAYPSIQ